MTMIGFRLPEPFHAELEQRGETIVVVASGEIDLACAYDLAASLRAASNRCERVVLDLREVSFLDCAGLRQILGFHFMAGGDFALIPGPSQVQRLFHITGVLDVLRFVEDGDIEPA